MLTRKLLSATGAIFIGLLFVICQPAVAQNQSSPVGKASAKKSKANAEKCDGALDIVPAKAMTFIRKRRPSNAEQPRPAGATPEKQQSGESKQSR
jgi:hypothetical protein